VFAANAKGDYLSLEASNCVLLIGTNTADTQFVAQALGTDPREAFAIEHASKISIALDRINRPGVRAVILDMEMADGRGVAAFKTLYSAAPNLPILILTSPKHENFVRQTADCDVHDYILKAPLKEYRLRRAVRQLLARKAAEDAAFQKQQCAEAALSCTGDAVLVSDCAGHIREMNTAAELLTGWTRQDACGRSLREVLPILDATTRQPVRNPLVLSAPPQVVQTAANYVLRRRDGVEVDTQQTCTPTRDRHGNVTGAVMVLRDSGAARAKTLELSHLAQHDFLTDLPNRLLLNDRITQAIAFAERYTKQLAVMFVDLDHFKEINDTHGHAAGDKLLQQVAARIVSCVRRSDTVSRQGGDEFVVLLSQVGHAEDAVFIARKILSSLAMPYSVDQKLLHIQTSVGVSTYPGDGLDAETLIHKADTAMYEAKKLGRNNCQFFRSDMQARVMEWHSLAGNLRGALSRNEFKLHYQPKIDLKTQEISGVEALLRWEHPERGLISPAHFVPIAEESGLIVPIGHWVLLEACRQARAWLDAGLPPVRMAVNVSALEFIAKDFLPGVRHALLSTGVEPYNLELELTETVLMQDAESAIETLNTLKSLGVQLAVDDFGTGYSSFSYLRKFPLDSLKVDRSFINEISTGSDNATILSALINIGKSLKHRVVAEGVETKQQLDFLQKQDCSEGQGYFFSYPVTADKFAEYLAANAKHALVH
jgi:diguanylate cyclase (GGDEF)-like protein/PAS domain S-box-containing protein